MPDYVVLPTRAPCSVGDNAPSSFAQTPTWALKCLVPPGAVSPKPRHDLEGTAGDSTAAGV